MDEEEKEEARGFRDLAGGLWTCQEVVGLCVLKVKPQEFVDGLDGSVQERSTDFLQDILSFGGCDVCHLSTNTNIQ